MTKILAWVLLILLGGTLFLAGVVVFIIMPIQAGAEEWGLWYAIKFYLEIAGGGLTFISLLTWAIVRVSDMGEDYKRSK